MRNLVPAGPAHQPDGGADSIDQPGGFLQKCLSGRRCQPGGLLVERLLVTAFQRVLGSAVQARFRPASLVAERMASLVRHGQQRLISPGITDLGRVGQAELLECLRPQGAALEQAEMTAFRLLGPVLAAINALSRLGCACRATRGCLDAWSNESHG